MWEQHSDSPAVRRTRIPPSWTCNTNNHER
jgi:hypothetical protein